MGSGPNGSGWHPIVNQAPEPPFDAIAALEQDQQRALLKLAKARQEREAAEDALAELGGHRRLTRRHDRQRAEQRLDRTAGAEAGSETVLRLVGERRKRLDAELAEWKAWTAEHGTRPAASDKSIPSSPSTADNTNPASISNSV